MNVNFLDGVVAEEPGETIEVSPGTPSSKAKSLPERLVMLGVPFDRVRSSEVIDQVDAMIASGRPHVLATANANFLRLARHDDELHRVLCEAELVVCDGMPLVWASRWFGMALPERVAGSELVPRLLDRAEAKGHRVFFLGGSPDVLNDAEAAVRERWPELKIAGTFSPPYAALEEMDHEAITKRIANSKADLVFVSFGCPKQEKWLSCHLPATGASVGIGVGATIDFLAGRVRQAPIWMRRCGLEWFWRMCQEPKRLVSRYCDDLLVVVPAIFRQWWYGWRIRLSSWNNRKQPRAGFRTTARFLFGSARGQPYEGRRSR